MDFSYSYMKWKSYDILGFLKTFNLLAKHCSKNKTKQKNPSSCYYFKLFHFTTVTIVVR